MKALLGLMLLLICLGLVSPVVYAQFAPMPEKCASCEITHTVAPIQDCPEYLVQKKINDKAQSRWIAEQCSQKNGRWWTKATDFEKDLSQWGEYATEVPKAKSHLTEGASGCATLTRLGNPIAQKEVVVEQYGLLMRTRVSLLSSLKSLAEVNSLLALQDPERGNQSKGSQNLMEGTDCSSLHLSTAREWCEYYQKTCKKAVQTPKAMLGQYFLSSNYGTEADFEALYQEGAENLKLLDEEFRQQVKSEGGQGLRQLKKLLTEQIATVNHASECLLKASASKRCLSESDQIERTFDSLPPFETPTRLESRPQAFLKSGKEGKNYRGELRAQYNGFFNAAECRRALENQKRATWDLVAPPVMVIGIATGGAALGALGASGTVTAGAANAGRMISWLSRGAAEASKAAQFVSKGAQATDLLVNAGLTADGLYHAFSCFKNAQSLARANVLEANSYKNQTPLGCPLESVQSEHKKYVPTDHYLSCGVSAAFAGLGVLGSGKQASRWIASRRPTENSNALPPRLDDTTPVVEWLRPDPKFKPGKMPFVKQDPQKLADFLSKQAIKKAHEVIDLGKNLSTKLFLKSRAISNVFSLHHGSVSKGIPGLKKSGLNDAEIYTLMDHGVFGKIHPDDAVAIKALLEPRERLAQEFEQLPAVSLNLSQPKNPSRGIKKVFKKTYAKRNHEIDESIHSIPVKNLGPVALHEPVLRIPFSTHANRNQNAFQHQAFGVIWKRCQEMGVKIYKDHTAIPGVALDATASVRYDLTSSKLLIGEGASYAQVLEVFSQLKWEKKFSNLSEIGNWAEIAEKVHQNSIRGIFSRLRSQAPAGIEKSLLKDPDVQELGALLKEFKVSEASRGSAPAALMESLTHAQLLKASGMEKWNVEFIRAKVQVYQSERNLLEARLQSGDAGVDSKSLTRQLKKVKRKQWLTQVLLGLKETLNRTAQSAKDFSRGFSRRTEN